MGAITSALMGVLSTFVICMGAGGNLIPLLLFFIEIDPEPGTEQTLSFVRLATIGHFYGLI